MTGFAMVPRWVVEGGRKILAQAFVSLCATVAVALVTQSFLKAPVAPATPPVVVNLDEMAAANLLRTGFQPGMGRPRVVFASEFEALAPPSIQMPLPATPSIVLVRDVEPAPAKPLRKPTILAAQACTTECPPAVPGMLPPARPADERPVTVAAVQIADAKKPEGRRLFGVTIPDFVPSGETIVKSGAMAVNSVVALGTSAIDLTASAIR